MTGEHLHEHGHDAGDQGHAPGQDIFGESFWDERYASKPAIWSGDPNPQLVAEVVSLRTGTALDAGCGEGADAIWLAEQGWRVTAVDISKVALERGAAQSHKIGDDVAERITWQQVDLRTWRPQPASYDLVSAQFMQLPPSERGPFYSRLAEGVASGGTLLVVGHSPTDMQTTVRRPQWPELYFTADEIASILDPTLWRIAVKEARERESRDPECNAVTVHDEVVTARRL
jgi:SAM-dependent methyltransferase